MNLKKRIAAAICSVLLGSCGGGETPQTPAQAAIGDTQVVPLQAQPIDTATDGLATRLATERPHRRGDARLSMLGSATAGNDFNGDGRTDVLWHNSAIKQVVVWLMDGTTVVANAVLPIEVGADWSVQGVRDFDNDGNDDVLWRSSATGQLVVWFMNGTTIASSRAVAIVGPEWNIQDVGDHDNNGRANILWRGPAGHMVVWSMNGATISDSRTFATVDVTWGLQGVRDFDGDGKVDFLWRNSTTGQIVVWLMDGFVIESTRTAHTVGIDWGIQGVGDFDGDGRADILWQDLLSGQIVVWLMNGFAIQSSQAVYTVPNEWTVHGIRDFNGDGKADVLWRNFATGQTLVWLMNGTMIEGSPMLPVVDTFDTQASAAPNDACHPQQILQRYGKTSPPDYTAILAWANAMTSSSDQDETTTARVEVDYIRLLRADAAIGSTLLIADASEDYSLPRSQLSVNEGAVYPRLPPCEPGASNTAIESSSVSGGVLTVDLARISRQLKVHWWTPQATLTPGSRYFVESRFRVTGKAHIQFGIDYWRYKHAPYTEWDETCVKSNNCEGWVSNWFGDTGGEFVVQRLPAF